MSGLNEGRILDGTPRKLRESFAIVEDALGLHLKSALLRHGSIPAGTKR